MDYKVLALKYRPGKFAEKATSRRMLCNAANRAFGGLIEPTIKKLHFSISLTGSCRLVSAVQHEWRFSTNSAECPEIFAAAGIININLKIDVSGQH